MCAEEAVRAVVRQSIARGCQAYIIREGWEGLVRGNDTKETSAPTPYRTPSASQSPALNATKSVSFSSLPPSQQFKLDEAAAEHDHSHHYHPHDIDHPDHPDHVPHAETYTDPERVAPLSDAPLSFGYGELLKDGAGEGDIEELEKHGGAGLIMADRKDEKGKSLKGRYIVRVGWDDVKGWLGEGGTLIGSSRCPSCEYRRYPISPLWREKAPWTSLRRGSSNSSRPSSSCAQSHQIRDRLSGRLWRRRISYRSRQASKRMVWSGGRTSQRWLVSINRYICLDKMSSVMLTSIRQD